MKQMPHIPLTEEEIKNHISELSIELQELKENIIEEIEHIENRVYLLKKHFCPEKFYTTEVSMKDLMDLMDKGYSSSSPVKRIEK